MMVHMCLWCVFSPFGAGSPPGESIISKNMLHFQDFARNSYTVYAMAVLFSGDRRAVSIAILIVFSRLDTGI